MCIRDRVMTAARAQMLIYPGYLKQRKLMKIDSFSSYERDVLHLLAKGEKLSLIHILDGTTRRAYVKDLLMKLDQETPGAKERMFHAIVKIGRAHV